MAKSTTNTRGISAVSTAVIPPGPTATGTQAIPRKAAKTAVTAKRRRARIDWYGLGILLLILLSGAVALYRLLWSMQP